MSEYQSDLKSNEFADCTVFLQERESANYFVFAFIKFFIEFFRIIILY